MQVNSARAGGASAKVKEPRAYNARRERNFVLMRAGDINFYIYMLPLFFSLAFLDTLFTRRLSELWTIFVYRVNEVDKRKKKAVCF